MKRLLPLCLLAATAACGTGAGEETSDYAHTTYREAKIKLRPAIDFAHLFDSELAERIMIDEIHVNVSDVRLLGAHPEIPVGGLPLISEDVQLFSENGDTDPTSLDFPPHLASDDLAVYVMIAPNSALEDASVVVRGRLFTRSIFSGLGVRGLSVDPDGEPADKPGTEEVDPDGEPADKPGTEEVDPDGEPADRPGSDGMDPLCNYDGARCSVMHSGLQLTRSVAFELRATDLADMVVDFGRDAAFDAVLAVPASRWLTPDAVQTLERELFDNASQIQEDEVLNEDGAVVLEDHRVAEVGRSEPSNGDEISQPAGDDYRLHRGEEIDPNRIRER